MVKVLSQCKGEIVEHDAGSADSMDVDESAPRESTAAAVQTAIKGITAAHSKSVVSFLQIDFHVVYSHVYASRQNPKSTERGHLIAEQVRQSCGQNVRRVDHQTHCHNTVSWTGFGLCYRGPLAPVGAVVVGTAVCSYVRSGCEFIRIFSRSALSHHTVLSRLARHALKAAEKPIQSSTLWNNANWDLRLRGCQITRHALLRRALDLRFCSTALHLSRMSLPVIVPRLSAMPRRTWHRIPQRNFQKSGVS